VRKIPIIIGVLIAAAITLILATGSDISSYSTFDEAATSGRKAKIAGMLVKDKPIDFDPQKDPNLTTFFVSDPNGIEKKVMLLSPKPKDFELSETVVLTGRMQDDVFIASEALLKCPSKYKDDELYVRQKENQG
jgi:cytochrome c-type biogenesis protein CcmE